MAVQLFLVAGMGVNTKNDDGMTVLMLAAFEGHLSVVQALLDKGAEVKAKDNKGRTALMRAVLHTKVVKLLRRAGAG